MPHAIDTRRRDRLAEKFKADPELQKAAEHGEAWELARLVAAEAAAEHERKLSDIHARLMKLDRKSAADMAALEGELNREMKKLKDELSPDGRKLDEQQRQRLDERAKLNRQLLDDRHAKHEDQRHPVVRDFDRQAHKVRQVRRQELETHRFTEAAQGPPTLRSVIDLIDVRQRAAKLYGSPLTDQDVADTCQLVTEVCDGDPSLPAQPDVTRTAPAVALARFGAWAVDADRGRSVEGPPPAIDRTTTRPELTRGEQQVWDALEGRQLDAEGLAKRLGPNSANNMRGVVLKIRRKDRVIDSGPQGYYRPDAPPR